VIVLALLVERRRLQDLEDQTVARRFADEILKQYAQYAEPTVTFYPRYKDEWGREWNGDPVVVPLSEVQP